jgi:hypothetical protein
MVSLPCESAISSRAAAHAHSEPPEECDPRWRKNRPRRSAAALPPLSRGGLEGFAVAGTGTKVRCKPTRRKPFIGRTPPPIPPLIPPCTGGRQVPLCERGARGVGGRQARFPGYVQAAHNLRKPETADLSSQYHFGILRLWGALHAPVGRHAAGMAFSLAAPLRAGE